MFLFVMSCCFCCQHTFDFNYKEVSDTSISSITYFQFIYMVLCLKYDITTTHNGPHWPYSPVALGD